MRREDRKIISEEKGFEAERRKPKASRWTRAWSFSANTAAQVCGGRAVRQAKEMTSERPWQPPSQGRAGLRGALTLSVNESESHWRALGRKKLTALTGPSSIIFLG